MRQSQYVPKTCRGLLQATDGEKRFLPPTKKKEKKKKSRAPSTRFLCRVNILGCRRPRMLYQPEDGLSGEICALKQYQFQKGEDAGQTKEEGRQERSREPRNSTDSGMGISAHG